MSFNLFLSASSSKIPVYVNIERSRFAVIVESNCLKEPLAAFLGLAKTFSPFH